MRKRGARNPLGRSPRRGLLHHAVDLFEGEALSLGDEEVRVDEAGDAEGAPEEEDACAEIGFVSADEVGGDNSDDLGGKHVSWIDEE